MASILSTKVLDQAAKNHLLNAGLGFTEYDAIGIEFLPVNLTIPSTQRFTHLVFTSKNGFRAFYQTFERLERAEHSLWSLPVYCVGETTAARIAEEGFEVQAMFPNAGELADFLTAEKGLSLAYFKGNRSLPTLAEKLQSARIAHREFSSYRTVLKSKSFDRAFAGVLFFSPSGVESHCTNNIMNQTIAFCIGHTTAAAASKYTDHIKIAPKPTTTQLILQAIKHFKTSPYTS